MTRIINAGLVGASLVLALSSPSAFSNETVHVSSLSGLRTAIDNAPPGRTIRLKKGVYRQTSPIRIVGKRNITITGATDSYADTVIRGPGIDDKSLQVNIKLNNSDDITITNLTVRDSYYHGIQLNNDSDRFTADGVRARDNGESGFKVTSPLNASGPAAYSDNGTISDSIIGFSDRGHRGVVEGIDIVGAKGWRISGNRLENIKSKQGRAAYAVFAKGNSQDIIFENNTVKNSFIGLSFGGGGTNARYFRNGDTRFETRGGIIRNNVVYNVADAGIYLSKASRFKVYGNTVINNGEGTGAIESRFKASSGTIRDNRISGPIKRRNGGMAVTRDNTRISSNTPLPGSSKVASSQ